MVDKLTAALDKVKEEMSDEASPTETTGNNDEKKQESKVSTAKKKTGAKKRTKPAAVPVKKSATKKVKPAEGLITLKEVAKEFKLDARKARMILRNAELQHEGRWSWPKGSAELTKVRKALTPKD